MELFEVLVISGILIWLFAILLIRAIISDDELIVVEKAFWLFVTTALLFISTLAILSYDMIATMLNM